MFNLSIIKYHNYRYLPTQKLIHQVCKQSIVNQYKNISLSISIVNVEDSQSSNLLYRGKDAPTNVISLEYPDTINSFNNLMGEIILCNNVIVQEALEQNKTILAHYVHMLVHGMLHLQGYDHQNDIDAKVMESLEIDILAKFNYPNPYKC